MTPTSGADKDLRNLDRDFDIVLFGATGFTGELTAEYLLQHGPKDLRWALAGRNLTKLEAVRDRLSAIDDRAAELELLVADAVDAKALADAVRRSRVVITTVGPYLQHGAKLVAACAENGTDYVDLTGEPEFVDRTYLADNEAAERSGARIVHACGFDSIPHDLGALFTINALAKKAGGEITAPVTMRGVVRTGGTFSSGTFHSALGQFARARQMKEAYAKRRSAEKAAASAAGPAAARSSRSVTGNPTRDPALGYWLLPLPTIDPIIVARSGAKLPAYGPKFRYLHYAGIKTLPYVVGGVAAVGGLTVAAQIAPVRNFLLSRFKPGEGPSEERRAEAWFTVDFLAQLAGVKVHTRVSGGDPGYTETSKMLAESALCLAFDNNPQTAGQVTTAVAMGDNLIQRLEKAGISFEVIG